VDYDTLESTAQAAAIPEKADYDFISDLDVDTDEASNA
jgi:hypothetical protein